MSHSLTPLRLRLVQDNPTVGALERNCDLALLHLGHARDQGIDLLVFPECFLTGYPLQDLVVRPGFLSQAREQLQRLADAVLAQGGPAVLMGTPLSGTNLPLNAAVLLRPDGSRSTLVKSELPNNDVFDEHRTFDRGIEPRPLALGGWSIGAMVCEDMWHGRVGRQLADEGADFFLVINGSPMEMGKQQVRYRHARNRVIDAHIPLIYTNLTGGQDELVFDGASFVLDREGGVVAQAPNDPCVLDLELSKTHDGATVVQNIRRADDLLAPAVESLPDEETLLYWTLVTGLRDYVHKNGFKRVTLGLSGGLDSALVAALAVDALGPEGLVAVMMPAAFTGAESRDLAQEMAQRLGCSYASVAVGAGVQTMETLLNDGLNALQTVSGASARRLASENLQARVRGLLLMALSNAQPDVLVLTTGNKSEMSVGYATLYGDMCGAFNPIKDLYKTRARALALWRNTHHAAWMKGPADPIPDLIITRPPTAELAAEQTDEASLGAYPVLDAVLEGLVERLLSPEAAAREASRALGQTVDVGYAMRIAHLVRVAEFKRRQAPPGIKITARSFGFGWRYPITNAAPGFP